MKTITIFGSSSSQPDSEEYRVAYELGKALGTAGLTVCNGGYGGTMEASAQGAIDVGGRTIGVICTRFGASANRFILETIRVETHSERLHKLIEYGDAYVVLKGSTGTLVELALVWEYMNKQLMPEKPILILGDFWKQVVETLNEEFIFEGKERATKYVKTVRTIEECVHLLR